MNHPLLLGGQSAPALVLSDEHPDVAPVAAQIDPGGPWHAVPLPSVRAALARLRAATDADSARTLLELDGTAAMYTAGISKIICGEDFPKGLAIPRVFSDPGLSPYDQCLWETRTAVIKDDSGKVIATYPGVRFPAHFSQLATDIVATKYFRGDADKGIEPAEGGRETDLRQLISRVVDTISDWGWEDGYFASKEDSDAFQDELTWLCLNQHGAFNSPVWFNVGIGQKYGIRGAANGWRWDTESDSVIKCEDSHINQQCAACFIVSVADDMESILERVKIEGMLFKFGSGVGCDNSTIRSTREKLSHGGKPSGPVSFMRIYDAAAGQIKSGGAVRRAAKIETLKCDHPDIIEFIEAKPNEDRKARALVAGGFSGGMNGEASATVCFQNSNISVRATDRFMDEAETPGLGTWKTKAVTTDQTFDTGLTAMEILTRIAEGTWQCGDPGMQFEDSIQRWHTIPNTARIDSSNPCSEYMSINDSACNLAAINWRKFVHISTDPATGRRSPRFDTRRFRAACRVFALAQEILVDHASYPTAAIAANAHKHRELGLGPCGVGGVVMAFGLPYDSDAGRSLAGAIQSLLHGEACLSSSWVARDRGPFTDYEDNREHVARVMGMHRDAAIHGLSDAYNLPTESDSVSDEIERIWKESELLWAQVTDSVARHGLRNSQLTVAQPCGTVGFMMDSGDFTGPEPGIALVSYKTLSGGGILKNAVSEVASALDSLGYAPDIKQDIIQAIDATDTIEGSRIHPNHLPVFDCAFPPARGSRSIAVAGHIKMMASLQPFISGAISKSVNLPKSATVADIRDAYLMAWRFGLKAVAIYRDGSKESQPVSTTRGESSEPAGPTRSTAGWSEVDSSYDDGVFGELVRILNDHAERSPAEPSVEILRRLIRERESVRSSPSSPGGRPGPVREHLPDTRRSITHKMTVQGVEGFITIGEYPDGRPGEMFISIANEGSTLGGLMGSFSRAISVMLQYGVPIEVIVRKFSGGNFEPSGHTHNPDIPFVTSIVDYAVRYLATAYLPGYREANSPRIDPMADLKPALGSIRNSYPVATGDLRATSPVGPGSDMIAASHAADSQSGFGEVPHHPRTPSGPLCTGCGNLTIPNGARCWVCPRCGTTTGGCG